MIRYNSIVFGTKVILDDYYAKTMRQNEMYYQSNSGLHYKIGAMVGMVAYFLSIPLSEFQSIKAINKSASNFLATKQPQNRFEAFNHATQ